MIEIHSQPVTQFQVATAVRRGKSRALEVEVRSGLPPQQLKESPRKLSKTSGWKTHQKEGESWAGTEGQQNYTQAGKLHVTSPCPILGLSAKHNKGGECLSEFLSLGKWVIFQEG